MENRYPGIAGALLFLLLLVFLQFLFSMAFTIVGIVIQVDLLIYSIPIVSLLSFGIVILLLMNKTGIVFGTLFGKLRIEPLLYVSVAITSIGLSILLSEMDNLVRLFYPAPEWIDRFLKNLFSLKNPYVTLLILSVIAPVTEELLFRRIFLFGFLRRYGKVSAIMLCSLLFALIHLNPWQFAGAFVTGIYFSILFIKTESVLPSLFSHALFNGLPLFLIRVLDIRIPGYSLPAENVVFQPLWFDLSGFLCVLLGATLSWKLFRFRSDGENGTNRFF